MVLGKGIASKPSWQGVRYMKIETSGGIASKNALTKWDDFATSMAGFAES